MTLPTSPPRSRLLRQAAAALALYGATALVYLRPIWTTFRNALTPNLADPLFSVYTLSWVVHQIRLGLPDLWDANYFYPLRGALALSDHMLGPALAIAWLDNPVAGYNLLFFSSFVLSGVATWWVLRRSGLSHPAALFGGAAFAFSPFRMSHENHLMMLIMQWIPLTLWSWDRLLAECTVRWAALFLVFYGLQLTAGCYLAYMIHIPLAVILANRWASAGRRRLLAPESLRVLVPVGALALAAAVAIFLPYVRLSRRLDLTHDVTEIGSNAAALASYLSPAPENLYSLHPPRALWHRAGMPRWQQPFLRPENSLFAGFLPTLMAAYGLAELWRRHRVRPAAVLTRRQRFLLLLAAAAAIGAVAVGDLYTLDFAQEMAPLDRWEETAAWTAMGLVLALSLAAFAFLRRRFAGDLYLRWREIDPWYRGLLLTGAVSFALSLPVVYMPLASFVPGLDSMRVPARFGAFVSLTTAFLAAWGLDRLAERPALTGRRGRAAGLALAAVLAVELAPRPLHWVEVPSREELPEVYSWIRGRPEIHALVEIPLRPNASEAAYMYASTTHWKPIANGYSSFEPASYGRLNAVVRLLPEGDGLSLLEQMGITHLVVHGDRLVREAEGTDAEARGMAMVSEWERRFLGRRVERVYADDPERVYRIIPLSVSPEIVVPPPHAAASRGLALPGHRAG